MTPDELWRHPDSPSTRIWAFISQLRHKYPKLHDELPLGDYKSLHAWSVSEKGIERFWREIWEFVGVRAEVGLDDRNGNEKVGTMFSMSCLRHCDQKDFPRTKDCSQYNDRHRVACSWHGNWISA